MKKLFLTLMLLVGILGWSGVAHADIFAPIDVPAKVTSVQPTRAFLNYVNGTSNANTILTDVAAIINYLGVREGEAYQFNQHKWVTTTGATIITYAPWNLSLGASMLNADGVVGDLDWNVGNYLPVQNVPIMNLTQYLYVIGGAGAEEKSSANNAMKFASILGLEFKFSF